MLCAFAAVLFLSGCGMGEGGVWRADVIKPSDAATLVNSVDGLSNAGVACNESVPRFLDVGGTVLCRLEVTIDDAYRIEGDAELAEFFLRVLWAVETKNKPLKLAVTLNMSQNAKFDPVAALQSNGWETTRGKYVGELWGVFPIENGYSTGPTEVTEHFGKWPGKVPEVPIGLLAPRS